MYMKISPVVLVALSLLLVGCATPPKHAAEADVPSRKIERSMERIALEVRDELRLLAKIRDEQRMREMTQAEKEQLATQASIADLPDVMKQPVSLRLAAIEAGQACILLSDMMGYASVTEGTEPAQTIWTRINVENEPLYSAIYEVGRQTGDAFNMEIYPAAKLVRCVYKAERVR